MRRRFVWLGLAALALAGAVLVYRGPGQPIVRGHVGDVGAAMLVYAILGLAWPRAHLRTRVLATLGIATAIELGQLVWNPRSLAGELLIGRVFDVWDLVAYVVGTALAMAWERLPVRG